MGEEVIVCSALTIIVNYHSEILHTHNSNGATSNPTKESEKMAVHLNHVFLFHQNPVIPL